MSTKRFSTDKEERISINLTESEFKRIADLQKDLNLRGVKVRNNSEVLRMVVKCALENRKKLNNYLEKRLVTITGFNPEIDGFNSEAFARTFIDPAKAKLGINLLIISGMCRVYAGRGAWAEIDPHNGGLLILKGNPDGGQKRKSRADNCRVSFSLGDIKKVQIYDHELGKKQEYRYVPVEKLPPQKILELDLNYEDDEL